MCQWEDILVEISVSAPVDNLWPQIRIVTFMDNSDLDCESPSESSGGVVVVHCVLVQSLQIFPAIDLLHDAPDFEN